MLATCQGIKIDFALSGVLSLGLDHAIVGCLVLILSVGQVVFTDFHLEHFIVVGARNIL
jgi:hypothetical protein